MLCDAATWLVSDWTDFDRTFIAGAFTVTLVDFSFSSLPSFIAFRSLAGGLLYARLFGLLLVPALFDLESSLFSDFVVLGADFVLFVGDALNSTFFGSAFG